jgi:hypothetical protein
VLRDARTIVRERRGETLVKLRHERWCTEETKIRPPADGECEAKELKSEVFA